MNDVEFNRVALKQKQSLPLEGKVILAQQRIREWYEHWDGQVYVSFSGGKDSTVLLHLVRDIYPHVPAVFVNTGLEFPEIQQHVRKLKAEWGNIEIVRPKLRFDEVLKKYGYPVISKEVSQQISEIRHTKSEKLRQKRLYGDGNGGRTGMLPLKYRYMLDAPFEISAQCCNAMKKSPLKIYERVNKARPYIGTMACESSLRVQSWLKFGCNAFDHSKPQSRPLSIWTEQDVMEYIVRNDIPLASVYGEIKVDADGRYYTTGRDRTGCMFCMFGCHLEKESNRFQRLKQTHP